MKQRKVKIVFFKDAISAPGLFGGETALSTLKFPGIQMHLEPGMVIVVHQNQEIGIPTGNIKSIVFEAELVNGSDNK